jgi:putative membrane protein
VRRAGLLGLAALALGLVWLGGLQLVPHTFVAHMTMHVVVVAVGAPLLALALAGSRWDPVRHRPELFPPLPISLIELVVVWAWHTPVLHHAARHGTAGLVAEQALFLVAGVLLWLAAFGGRSDDRVERAGAGFGAMLLTSMHMTLLGALLALAPRPLFSHVDAVGGLTALEDQQLGGAIMLIGGGVAYLAGGLALIVELLRSAGRRQEAAG